MAEFILYAPVTQLVRVPGLYPVSAGFESLGVYQLERWYCSTSLRRVTSTLKIIEHEFLVQGKTFYEVNKERKPNCNWVGKPHLRWKLPNIEV